ARSRDALVEPEVGLQSRNSQSAACRHVSTKIARQWVAERTVRSLPQWSRSQSGYDIMLGIQMWAGRYAVYSITSSARTSRSAARSGHCLGLMTARMCLAPLTWTEMTRMLDPIARRQQPNACGMRGAAREPDIVMP